MTIKKKVKLFINTKYDQINTKNITFVDLSRLLQPAKQGEK